jgi:hypothetical protein
MKNKTMTDKQKTAIRCAFADLIGAVQAYNQTTTCMIGKRTSQASRT